MSKWSVLVWEIFILIFVASNVVDAWDNDDLEVFDVVEEVNQNFYELLGVTQNASSSEVRSAYRSLTLKLHPDKNDAPDAEVQFRNLVSVYNIIKDPGKREKYNEVLQNGLPNWKSAVYYYRHVRKMGLAEMSIILFIIITIGQYIVYWASYAEKKYLAQQFVKTKISKKKKCANEVIEINIPTPTVKDLLPCQIVRLVIATVCFIPRIPGHTLNFIAERKQRILEEQLRQEEEEQERLRQEEDAVREKEFRALRRRRKGFEPPERSGDEPGCVLYPVDEPEKPVQSKPTPPVSGGLWTDDDLTELVRLVKKYPPGTSGRWERIGEAMCRGVPEVTHMAAKLKDNCYRVPGTGTEQQDGEIPGLEVTKKVKTKGGRLAAATSAGIIESVWSQTQQRALENALAKYPRGGASDRWDKIAKCVPDKTKEECMLRFKHLAELLKKQKSNESPEPQGVQDGQPSSESGNQSKLQSDPHEGTGSNAATKTTKVNKTEDARQDDIDED